MIIIHSICNIDNYSFNLQYYHLTGEIIYYARPREEVTRSNSDNGYQGL